MSNPSPPQARLRVCFDTSVLIAAMFFPGIGRSDFDSVIRGRVELICSVRILDEFEFTAIRRFHTPPHQAYAMRKMIQAFSTMVVPTPISRTSPDPFDDHVLGAALAGQAAYLVSEDKKH